MGDDGGYGDNSGGGYGGNNYSNNNNYAESYNNYSYTNDTNDFSNKYGHNDTKSSEDTRSYSAFKSYEPSSKSYEDSSGKSYEPPSKVYEEPTKTFEETRNVFEDTRPEPSTPAPPPPNVPEPESHSHLPKTEAKEPEQKKSSILDAFAGGDDDDENDELKGRKEAANENITVTTAEINTPPGATCDHKTLAVLLGSVTAGHMSAEAAGEMAEMEALASLHDACKCNGSSRVAADDINLDDTKESMDLLNDSSETRPVDLDEKKVEEDDCLLDVVTFCVTCCECVIS